MQNYIDIIKIQDLEKIKEMLELLIAEDSEHPEIFQELKVQTQKIRSDAKKQFIEQLAAARKNNPQLDYHLATLNHEPPKELLSLKYPAECFLPAPKDCSYANLTLAETLNALLSKNIISSEEKDRLLTTGKAVFISNAIDCLVSRYELYDLKRQLEISELDDLLYFLKSDPVLYYQDLSSQQVMLRDNTKLSDYVPSHKINLIMSAIKESYTTEGKNLAIVTSRVVAPLAGKFIIPMLYDEFSDWKYKAKDAGKDFGFILVHPKNNKRWYVKKTDNEVNEFFVSRYMICLGVKYPETRILADNNGTLLLATMDMSRKYSKNESKKEKSFLVFAELLEQAGLKHNFAEEREPLTEADKEKYAAILTPYFDQQTRISFAKELIVGKIFGLTDLGGHWGNMGLILRQADNKKQPAKIGLVDFQSHILQIESPFQGNFIEEILAYGKEMNKVFKYMTDLLTEEDILVALDELLEPKERLLDKSGYLLTAKDKKKLPVELVLKQEFDACCKTIRELQNRGVLPEEIEKHLEQAKKEFEIFKSNIDKLYEIRNQYNKKSQLRNKIKK